MADSTSYSVKITGGVDANVLATLDAFKEKVMGTQELLTGLAEKAAAFFAGSEIIRFATEAIKSADELHHFSQEVGIAVDELSKFKFAADMEGAGDHFRAGMLKFSNALAQSSDEGSKAAQVFKAIGVSTKDAEGNLRPTAEVLMDVANRFKSWSDGANKAAISMELFGNKNAQMISLLNQGAEGFKEYGAQAQQYGLVVTEEAAERARLFTQQITILKGELSGLARDVATGVLPTFIDLAKVFVDAGSGVRTFSPLLEGLNITFRLLAEGILASYTILEKFALIITRTGQMAVAAAKMNFAEVAQIYRQLDKEGQALWEKRADQMSRLWNPIPALVQATPRGATAQAAKAQAPNLPGPGSSPNDEARQSIDALKSDLQLQEQALALDRARANADFWASDYDKHAATVQLLQKQIEFTQAYIADLQRMRDVEKDPKASASLDKSILEGRQAQTRLESQKIGQSNFADPRNWGDQWAVQMKRIMDQTKTLAQVVTESFGQTMLSAFEKVGNSVSDIILKGKTMGQVWAQAGQQIFQAITGMVAQYVAGKLAMMAVDAIASKRSKGDSAATAAAAIPAGIAKAGEQGGWVGILVYIGVFAAAMAAITALATAASGGFEQGGYTGSLPTDQVAGVVHGQEYVMPAGMTSRYFGVLEQMRTGNYDPGAAGSYISGAGAGGTAKRGGGIRGGSSVHVMLHDPQTRQQEREMQRKAGAVYTADYMRKRGAKIPV